MKIRKGFVSNSSSASFVITWKCNVLEEGEGIDVALHLLLNCWDAFNEDTKKLDFMVGRTQDPEKKCRGYHKRKVVEWIIANTKTLEHGLFKTSFWTSMFNDYDDFGSALSALTNALVCNGAYKEGKDFKILDTEIQDEN